MRILMINYAHLQPHPDAPEVGGAARQCVKLSKALTRRGVDVTILTSRLTWGGTTLDQIDGVPVVYLNTLRPILGQKGLRKFGLYAFMVSALLYLRRRRDDYDIFHAHSALVPGFVAVLAGKLLKKKSLIKMMNSGPRNDIIRFKQDKSLIGTKHMANYLFKCDKVIALNSDAYSELIGLGFSDRQIISIPNGVEVKEIRSKSLSSQVDPVGPTRLIFVGRLTTTKKIDVLLRACHLLQNEWHITNFQLDILGRGGMDADLRKLSQALNLGNRVNFIGEIADVPEYLHKTDIFILPSDAEGISNALLEAMASGLACIASDVAGNRQLIQHERNGLLVETGNEVALATAIKNLIEDNNLRRQLGMAARKTVEEKFSIDAVALQYISLYQEILTHREQMSDFSAEVNKQQPL